MTIRLDSTAKAVGFFLVVAGSIALSVIAAGANNQYWSGPLIALAIVFVLKHLPPPGNRRTYMLYVYFLLILGSGAMLLYTNEQIYWTTPLILAVIAMIYAPEIDTSR